MNVILAHGSPDERHRRQVRELASTVSEQLGKPVRAGFLDGGSLPVGATILPLFLGEGKHVLNDAVQLAGQSDGRLLPSLLWHAGEIAEMAAGLAAKETSSHRPVLFALYRFHRFERLLAALNSQGERFPRMALASLHGLPDCSSILNAWYSEGVRHAIVQPAFLFHGHTMEQLKATICAEELNMNLEIGLPLAAHPEFPDLLAKIFSYAKKNPPPQKEGDEP